MSTSAKFFSFPNPVNDVANEDHRRGLLLIVSGAAAFRQPLGCCCFWRTGPGQAVAGPLSSPRLLVTGLFPKFGLPMRPVPGPPNASPSPSVQSSPWQAPSATSASGTLARPMGSWRCSRCLRSSKRSSGCASAARSSQSDEAQPRAARSVRRVRGQSPWALVRPTPDSFCG